MTTRTQEETDTLKAQIAKDAAKKEIMQRMQITNPNVKESFVSLYADIKDLNQEAIGQTFKVSHSTGGMFTAPSNRLGKDGEQVELAFRLQLRRPQAFSTIEASEIVDAVKSLTSSRNGGESSRPGHYNPANKSIVLIVERNSPSQQTLHSLAQKEQAASQGFGGRG